MVQNKCDNDIHLQNNDIHKVKPIMTMRKSRPASMQVENLVLFVHYTLILLYAL